MVCFQGEYRWNEPILASILTLIAAGSIVITCMVHELCAPFALSPLKGCRETIAVACAATPMHTDANNYGMERRKNISY